MHPLIRALAQRTPKPARRALERLLDPYVRIVTQSVPIDEVVPDDVFIVGFPKSGNTWFQHIVAGLVFRANLEFTPDALVQDLVPDVHYRRYYRRYIPRMFFKSHHLPQPEYRRVVYLVRDGRDAIISYYHFLNQLHGRTYDLSRLVRYGEALDHGPWHEHVDAWLANPFGAEMIVIRYEDLRARCAEEIRRFCEFADLDSSAPLIDDVARSSSFESMQAREKKFGMEAWDSSKGLFIRRGKVGGFRDEMPPDILEAFNAQSDGALRKFGYL
jgi:hypothetical protein